MSWAVIDANILYAATDQRDSDHERARNALRIPGVRLVIPMLVLAEVFHLVGRRLGPDVGSRFVAGLGRIAVEPPLPEEWARIAELVGQYRDFPLGGTDASIVALAERLNIETIITLDQRHFRAIRPRHVEAFRLLPE
ncbi:MAG: type II toxin-antitoxin system VapC family toxin [Thermomicrobiales bacterium]